MAVYNECIFSRLSSLISDVSKFQIKATLGMLCFFQNNFLSLRKEKNMFYFHHQIYIDVYVYIDI